MKIAFFGIIRSALMPGLLAASPYVHAHQGMDLNNAKILSVGNIQNRDLGLYSAECVDSNGNDSRISTLIIGKDELFGDLPFAFVPNRMLAEDLETKHPASIMRQLYEFGTIRHEEEIPGYPFPKTIGFTELDHYPLVGKRELTKGVDYTAYSAYNKSGTIEWENRLYLGRDSDGQKMQFFVVEGRSGDGNLQWKCQTQSMLRQYYSGTTLEFKGYDLIDAQSQAVMNEAIKSRFNIASSIFDEYDKGFAVNKDGQGLFFDIPDSHRYVCTWNEEGQKTCALDDIENMVKMVYVEPPPGVKFKFLKSNFALGDDLRLYTIDKGWISSGKYILNNKIGNENVTPVEVFKSYKILDFVPLTEKGTCVLTTKKEVLCLDYSLSRLLSKLPLTLLGAYPRAVSFELALGPYHCGEHKGEISIKDKRGSTIRKWDWGVVRKTPKELVRHAEMFKAQQDYSTAKTLLYLAWERINEGACPNVSDDENKLLVRIWKLLDEME